ncbi:UNKNOWN [Stylonychia lemnae]|uniref:Transmembrane protein n=1 Tax=Stylonychia lemnae TaxID=5949 RepID=A0A078AL35_STYLE|nr:UNKNOWN [Stylonychia lemnae]|eukprot:CDW82591.1 UNKNOWN [Stylonychia lemnae]
MSQRLNQRSAIKALQPPSDIRVSSQSKRKSTQLSIKEQIEREFQVYKQNLQTKIDAASRDDKEQIFSCKDFVKTLHKKDSLDYNHILLYKSIQPFPLRESIEKLKIRDASKIPDPPQAKQVDVMKLNNIREYLSKNQEQAFQHQLKDINSQKGYSVKNFGVGGSDLKELVKTDYLNNLKERMKTGSAASGTGRQIQGSTALTDRLNRQSTQAQFLQDRVGDYDEIIYDSVDFHKQNTFDIHGAGKNNYSQFQENLARQKAKEIALEELRNKLAQQKDSPKKLSDIEKKAEQQPLYFFRNQKPTSIFQKPLAARTASQAVIKIESNRINLFSSPNDYISQNYRHPQKNFLLKDDGYNQSTPLSPVMSPLRKQINSINTALSLNDQNRVKHKKFNDNVQLKPNSIPIFTLTGADLNSNKSNHINSHRTLKPLNSGEEFQDYTSPDNFGKKHQKLRNQTKYQTRSSSKHQNSFNKKNNYSHSKNNNSMNSSQSRQSYHDNMLLQDLLENCDSTTKKLKRERTKITKNKKQVRQIFNQFKNRIRFNLQVNKQESLPEDMLEIKNFRHESQKVEEQKKQLQEIQHLEEMASKYHNWKQKLELKLKQKEEESIKETKQFLDNYKLQKGIEKADKIPARIKSKKLNAILEDKSLIEIYNNFELVSADTCNLIELSTKDIGSGIQSDIINQGKIQKSYDQRITEKFDLSYVPYEINQQTLYLQTTNLLQSVSARSSDNRLRAFATMKDDKSNDANVQSIKIDLKYECGSSIQGVPIVTISLQFDGCPNMILSWQKSCGNDKIEPMTGMYQLDPPYIKNLFQAQSIMYPVIKEFNCLGIEGTQDITLIIPSQFNDYQDIEVIFRKQCSRYSIFHALKQDLKESVAFDIIFILFLLLVVGSGFFCLVIFSKAFQDRGISMHPDYQTQINKASHSVKKNFNKFTRFVNHLIDSRKLSYKNLSQHDNSSFQNETRKNTALNSSSNFDGILTNAFDDEIQIDLNAKQEPIYDNKSESDYGGL